MSRSRSFAPLATVLALFATDASASPDDDRRAVATLDTAYQAAVERNDADAMAAILHDEMVVILGDGRVETRDDLLRLARERVISYERQIDVSGTHSFFMIGPPPGFIPSPFTTLFLPRA